MVSLEEFAERTRLRIIKSTKLDTPKVEPAGPVVDQVQRSEDVAPSEVEIHTMGLKRKSEDSEGEDGVEKKPRLQM